MIAETSPRRLKKELRLAISDDRRTDLRELRATFREAYKAGGFPAFRYQDGSVRSKYIDKVFGEFEKRKFGWSSTGGREGIAAYALARTYDDSEAVDKSFDRLATEIGLMPAFPGDFTIVFQFLSGVLTFPPYGIRPARRTFVEACDNLLRFQPNVKRGAPVFEPDEPDELRPNFGMPVGINALLEGASWPPLYGTYIADVCLAASEAIDAILDGRIVQRRFPFACPWTDDPFAPPTGTQLFRERWGWEIADSQEQLAHVLRAFYVADDCFETAESLSTLDNQIGDRRTASHSVSFSDDFLSVNWYGERFHFTQKQALMVRKLFDAHRRGHPDVTSDQLVQAAECSSPVHAIFSGHAAWRSMIVPVAGRKGLYRLAFQDEGGH